MVFVFNSSQFIILYGLFVKHPVSTVRFKVVFSLFVIFCFCFTSTGQRLAACNTSGSGVDLPPDPNDLVATHGPVPENSSLFMGFVFMLTASSESDRDSDHQTSDEDEGEGLEQMKTACVERSLFIRLCYFAGDIKLSIIQHEVVAAFT